MKLVRIATMAIALCAASASVAAAQHPDSVPPGGRRGGMMGGRTMGGRLLAGIELTDAQKAQQVTIREKYMPKMQELMMAARSTGAPPDSATLAQMASLRASYTAEIRATLNADQQKIFDKNIAEEKERMARMTPPPGN